MIWDRQCLADTSDSEIDDIIKFSELCKRQRIEFTQECFERKMDSGHYGAILKMEKIIRRCREEKERREEPTDRLTNRVKKISLER